MALDPATVLELLRAALHEAGENLEPTDVKIVELWYQPGEQCVILYQVELLDAASGRTAPQLLTACVLRRNQPPTSPPAELVTRYQTDDRRLMRFPSVYLPAARMMLSAFPLDPQLPLLVDAANPSVVRHHLARLSGERGAQIRNLDIRVLRYTPRIRATMLYDVRSEDLDAVPVMRRRLVAKIRLQDRPARVLATSLALQRLAEGQVHVAPGAGYIGSLGATLQGYVPGEDLGSLIGSASFPTLAREAASTLAQLHGLSLPLSRRDPLKDAWAVQRWSRVLEAIQPHLGARVAALRDGLVAALESQARVTGPIHGDFHPTNVVADGERITLVDLDEVALGDRMLDVGRFLASLRVSALRRSDEAFALNAEGAAFLDEYLHRAPGDERRVHLYEAAALLTSAAAPFRLQRPGWQQAATVLVEEAERTFSTYHGSTFHLAATEHKPSLTISERLHWAADAPYMQAMLAPHIFAAYGADLLDCAAEVRDETAEKFWVCYLVTGRRGDQPWGTSLEGYYWQQRQHRSLLDRLSELERSLRAVDAAPLLPRPIGELPLLSMLVVELPRRGARLSRLVGEPDAARVASQVGRALALLHQAPIRPDQLHDLQKQLADDRQSLARLKAVGLPLYQRATELGAEVERQCSASRPSLAPVLRTLSPYRIRCIGNRIAFTEFEDLTFSHPLLDAGDFLGQLALLGLERGKLVEVDEMGQGFRQAYSAATNVDRGALAAFEAASLLRLACSRVEHGQEQLADALIARAESRLVS
jgi:aminoglycoside phosphotransferase (APT) family kinase protein